MYISYTYRCSDILVHLPVQVLVGYETSIKRCLDQEHALGGLNCMCRQNFLFLDSECGEMDQNDIHMYI